MSPNGKNSRVLREISNIMHVRVRHETPARRRRIPIYGMSITLRIVLVQPTGEYVRYVDLSPACQMSSLKMSYAEHLMVPFQDLYFFYNGHLLGDDVTPMQLGMRDRDDVVVFFSPNSSADPEPENLFY